MNTPQAKKQILKSFLENLSGISDIEYQKRIWIEGLGPEWDNFDEAVCVFYDLGECIFDKYEEYKINPQQQKALDAFRKQFESFVYGDRPYLPEEFIDTPEWEEVTQMAKDVLAAFNYRKDD